MSKEAIAPKAFTQPVPQHLIQGSADVEQEYPIGELADFHIDVPFAHVYLKESDNALVQIKIQGDKEHPQLLPQVRQSGKTLQLYQHFVPALQTLWEKKTVCAIEVSVPRGFRISALLISGSIFIDHLSGPLSAEMKQGTISGMYVGTNMDLHLYTGSIKVHKLASSVNTWMATGTVELSWDSLSQNSKIDVICGIGDVAVRFPKEQETKAISHAGFFRKTQIRSQGGALISATVGVGNLWIA